jgi:hypothetical protein
MNRKTISLNGQKIAFSASPRKLRQTVCLKDLSTSPAETSKKEDINKGLIKACLIPTTNIRTQISARK